MILITGAAGHIGNVLARQLARQGKWVRTLLLRGEDPAPLQDVPAEIVEGDILDPASLTPVFKDAEVVYHLAGMISILPGKNEMVRRVNVEGTLNVIQAALQAGTRRLVYASSIHAIARAPHGVSIDERLPFDVHNPYGAYDRSKAEASLAVLEAARRGMDAVLTCPTGVIGPYDFRRSEMGQLILDCARCKPQLYVDGAYDFVDVRDVAQGMILAEEKGRRGECYILSGEKITVRRMLDTIREITGRGFALLKAPLPLARFFALFTPLYYRLAQARPRITPYSIEVLQSNAEISHAKAEQELGYAPRPLRQSLADAVAWFMEGRRAAYGNNGAMRA
ncbi:MAG: SDR family oxidoreductase [Chloroflexi bacterium]|nr:SDR family oxidoreductase [Chloroflexota bacterium]